MKDKDGSIIHNSTLEYVSSPMHLSSVKARDFDIDDNTIDHLNSRAYVVVNQHFSSTYILCTWRSMYDGR